MDKDCVAELVERLRYYAQNNEMIDQHFTESGRGLCEAAAALEQLQAERDEARRDAERYRGMRLYMRQANYMERSELVLPLEGRATPAGNPEQWGEVVDEMVDAALGDGVGEKP
jgi:hypothetical protein